MEGLWLGIGLGDEAVDGFLERGQGVEDAALQAPFGEPGEEPSIACIAMHRGLLLPNSITASEKSNPGAGISVPAVMTASSRRVA
jgi:hypothetical protein